ncbi:MAG: TetR/AcrR family transcriptional regulator [Oscillospiraceae bacterium]|nr:TetR/AcrR family transcriptional regulator [Oscillospiraceae bacterium]
MAKTCTTEKTALRQRWIEHGLLELMQKTRFEEITTTDLCRHLALSRRSFYRYFADMDDVLDSLIDHTFQDMAITDTGLTVPELERYYDFWLRQKALLNALAYSRLYSKFIQYALKYTNEETLKNHLSVNDLGLDLSREMNLFVISGLSSLLISWHGEGFQKSPNQMARIAYRMLSEPLLVHP